MFHKNHLVSLVRFGEEEPEVDFNKLAENPAFQDFLRAQVDKEVTPLKNKNADLLNEKKNLAEKMKAFESGIQEKDDLEALKAGKLDFQALLDKRIAANSQSWQEKLAAEQSEKEELRKAVDGEKGKLKQFQIKQTIGQVALKNEFFHPSALDDLMSVAGSTWQLGDSGELVARDSSGNVVFGKTGRPLTPEEWVAGLTASKPHYFKQMPGSGARGGHGSGVAVSLGDWQRKLASANDQEKAALLAKYKAGEISIQR
ncbi:hypothetical protein MYW52_25870 [Pseudomonas juntendi]|uniref:hypothetical protein n=1 Tax=Pseudomonas juntendi TaxID=2666183 RepID=UPI001FFCDF41|nr:hypothetical protein [Pseudomonas juntendi]MCK2118903.1 hypothetical protein [Pseudomonas juntendi]